MAEPFSESESAAVERFLTDPLLAGVEAGTRRAVFEALVEERAEVGAVLLKQGEPNDHLSFLIEGVATIERCWPEGRTERLATLQAPSVFGTTSFFGPNTPGVTVRAVTGVRYLTLSHPAHERLRASNPAAAEALALATVRVLTERFDLIDRLFTEFITTHQDDHSKVDEWAGFRGRLFQEPGA